MGIANDILTNLQKVVKGSYDGIKALAQQESQYFETQALMITNARIAEQLPDDQYNWFLKKLKEDVENFCRILCAETLLTLEKAWNVVAGAVWTNINKLLSAAGLGVLAIPSAPSP